MAPPKMRATPSALKREDMTESQSRARHGEFQRKDDKVRACVNACRMCLCSGHWQLSAGHMPG